MRRATSKTHRPIRAASFACVLLVLATSTAGAAEPAKVGIIVGWKGDQPAGAALGGVFPPTNLSLNAGKTAFETQYTVPGPGTYLSSISLEVSYADGTTASLPIRVWPQLPGLATTVYQVKYTACSVADLKTAEGAAGTIPGALKSFFSARALYLLEGDDQCSKNNRKRAAKAWFDRAYELTTLASYFDLSTEAAAAYGNYDADYVKRYRDEARGAALKLVSDARKQALKDGQFDLASGLNASLLKAIGKDASIRALALRLQGLTEDQLKLDGKNISGLADLAGVTAMGEAANIELGPNADLVKL